jgi:hypothetical protein
MPAPDSPRASESPPPPGDQGDLEIELKGLVNALYNLGTTVINDSTKEREKGGVKQVGARVCVYECLLGLPEILISFFPVETTWYTTSRAWTKCRTTSEL